MCGNVLDEISVAPHAGKNPDFTVKTGGIAAGIFQGTVSGFQKNALLRVGQSGFPLKIAEKFRIEILRVMQCAAGFHVIGVLQRFRRDAGRQQLLIAVLADCLLAPAQLFPKFGNGVRSGKSPGHSDDGNIAGCRIWRLIICLRCRFAAGWRCHAEQRAFGQVAFVAQARGNIPGLLAEEVVG